jgi:hypothetical protein
MGVHPLGRHRAGDRRVFQVLTSQLIDSEACTQAEVVRAFGVPKVSVARALRRYRAGGVAAFFGPRRGRRGGTVLTPEVLAEAQRLLDEGCGRGEVAEELAVPGDALRKALGDGRLRQPPLRPVRSEKSSRSVQDALAAEGLGTACTRVGERVLAAMGRLPGAPTRFEHCLDVPYGGVLCALPALEANGLLSGVGGPLNGVRGYYTAVQVLVLMGFTALCRIRNVEQLRGEAPGEFGRLLGLDRIPEVRCLRRKLTELAAGGAAERWGAELGRQWLEEAAPEDEAPESVGTLYVDGHVRVYHGSQTALPRRYVSRQRLCLRGITDYWVNDALGLPFFVVEKTVDAGLLDALRSDIVPRLLREVPGQPSEERLAKDELLCRFVLVFDREGYSPAFFGLMWREHRIGCITYHKHPRGEWPAEEFQTHTVGLPNGETVTMELAERRSLVGSGREAVWMREVRKLTQGGHQVSLISTAFALPLTDLAARLFSRWCQENFFRYMMQHFALDLLGEYGLATLPDTEKVVNPAWRDLAKRRNAANARLIRRRATFAAVTLHPEPQGRTDRFEAWLQRKAALLEDVEQLEHQLQELGEALRATERHIPWDQLPEEHRFQRLAPTRRQLLDAIRMIAYRAETAMVPMLLDRHTDQPAARALLQDLFRTPADILPEPNRRILRVRVHRASRPAADRRLRGLFQELNEAETFYPGTDLRLVYELVGESPSETQNGITSTSVR